MVTHISKKYEKLNGIQGKDIIHKLEALHLQRYFKTKTAVVEKLAKFTKNYKEEERKNIFKKFWNLEDFNKQNILLYEATKRCVVKRKRQKNGKSSPRNYNFKYLLNSKKGKVFVCKKFFLDTFKISDRR